jgi:hypothetical protein
MSSKGVTIREARVFDEPDGPWVDEPDYVRWDIPPYTLIARRSKWSGVWLGYIVVPAGHPWTRDGFDIELHVDVHGGVSFAGEPAAICDDDDTWPTGSMAIGFDCNHAYDLMPRGNYGTVPVPVPSCDTYKTLEFVQKELEGLLNRRRRRRHDETEVVGAGA